MTRPPDLVHSMILAQAAARPAAVAAMSSADALTYEALAARVLSVAGELRRAGVRADEVVGLAGPRSIESLVGLLGILTAGGAYLYLDPTLPADRLRHMLDECAVRVILTTDDMPFAPHRGRTIRVEDATSSTADPVEPRGGARPDSLAYVVYTSGSSGRPKGVAVEHAGVANMARQLARTLPVTAGTRVLQFSSWSWDASAAEILVPLAAGGTVVLAPEAARHGGDDLATLLRGCDVNVVTLTPSVLAATPARDLPELRTVAAVGETCPDELVRRWSAPGRRFLNGYGPTEATVAVSLGECRPGEEVHIGTVLEGVRVRIVDERERPVPPGEPGELLVAGIGLARGYMGQPQTEPATGRFFVDDTRTRWLRTGDRVRQRSDGKLVHLGRLDDQVQVHGHRVELGEIEHTLRRRSAVRTCAVTLRGGRLIAFVVADEPTGPGDLAATAREWLPPHMVPEIRLVERLPHTPGGKVDRARLARTEVGAAAPPDVREATPDDLLDIVLATVRRVLETDAVASDDDFFDIGGHSLLAAELSVDLSNQFGVDLPALTIVDNPTAAELADVLRTAARRVAVEV